MEVPIAEADVPPIYDLSFDNENVPQRNLTDFVVRRAGQLVSICALDDTHDSSPIVAEGRVIRGSISHANSGGVDEDGVRVRLGRLVEWCIEYHLHPVLWVRSSHAWYRLGAPAKEYVQTHEMARRRFELCARMFILGTMTNLEKNQVSYEGYVKLLSAPWEGMRGYSEQEIVNERDFILEQVRDLGDPRLDSNPFVLGLRGSKSEDGNKGTKKGGGGTRNKGSSVKEKKGAALWVPKYELDEEGKRKFMKKTEKIVANVSKHRNAWPFLQPVNPVRDGCPTYFDVIKTPMDLTTVKQRLSQSYYNNPLEVARDVRTIWKNCRLFNSDQHLFSQFAIVLERKFEDQLRNAEEAEFSAMKKRQVKLPLKRKHSESPDVSGSSKNSTSSKKPRGRKVGSINLPPLHPSSSVSSRASPDVSSILPSLLPSRGLQSASNMGPGRPCANESDCKNPAREGSKYCSDDCGMKVARRRMKEMMMAGVDIGEYLRQRTNKSLVLARMG